MASTRADYDQALKAMLARAHDGVLALVAPDLTFVAERPTELPAVRRDADLVWEVQNPDGEHGLLHLELQTRVEPDLGERLLEYVVRLYRHHHRPVRTVVVLLRQTEQPAPLPFRLGWGGRSTLFFDCDVVRLWEAPQALVLDRPEPALWPLATLMAGATLATVESVAGRLARLPTMSDADRREFVGLTAGLAGLRLPREAVLAALRRDAMLRDILRDSSVAQGWFEEGRQEGRQEGQRELVRQALHDRFGTLEPDVVAALETVDAATLRALVVHLGADTPAQIRQRLGLG